MQASGSLTPRSKGQPACTADGSPPLASSVYELLEHVASPCALVGGGALQVAYANAAMRALLGDSIDLRACTEHTVHAALHACRRGEGARRVAFSLSGAGGANAACWAERTPAGGGQPPALFVHGQGGPADPAAPAADGSAPKPAAATPSTQHQYFRRFCHDIRNAIGSAKMGADAICRLKGLPERVANKAARASLALQRADELLTRYADLRLLTVGEPLPMLREPGLLSDAIAPALSLLPIALRERVDCQVRAQGPGRWDASYLGRALCSLIDNAARFGSEGQRITVGLGAQAGELSLTVDNEAGPLDAATQLSIEATTPASRLEQQGAGSLGWGLGLALVRAVARAHGGRLELAHTDRQTRFSLIFASAGEA